MLLNEIALNVVILILTKDEDTLGETGEAIKEYCDGHNIKCHLVFSDMAFISSKENDKNLIIHNSNGEGKKIALSPTDTVCFNRGGIFDDESGLTFLKAIERTGVFMINSSKVMELSRNKLLSSLHFEKNNILTPRSTLINNEDTIDLALKKIGNKFPVIVKTVSGSEGIGVIKVESRETLTSILQALWEQGAELLLQEYIPIDFDIRTLVLNNTILGSTKRSKVERDFRTNLSLGGETSPYKLSTKEKEIVLKVAKSINGYFLGIDHILDGDNIFILESNGSPGTLSIFEDLSGKKISRGEIIKRIVSSATDKSTWESFK